MIEIGIIINVIIGSTVGLIIYDKILGGKKC